MKWILYLVLVVLLIVGGYFGLSYFSSGKLPTLSLLFNSEKSKVQSAALNFWEDIKFKDIKNASKLLNENPDSQKTIETFLRNLFKIDLERLDISSYEIVQLEIDSTGKRARVKTKVLAENLNTQQSVEQYVMLFFYSKDAMWFLDLQNSF